MKDLFNLPIAVQFMALALSLLFLIILYIGMKPLLFSLSKWFKTFPHSESLRISDDEAIKIDKAHAEANVLQQFEKRYNRKGLQID